MPFCYDDKDSKWHSVTSSSPHAAVTTEHFCQVHIQMLLTGKPKEAWCHGHIFRLLCISEWLQAALGSLQCATKVFEPKSDLTRYLLQSGCCKRVVHVNDEVLAEVDA